ncbi:MAG: hypothetical protein ANABAC_0205 [Anaerolineae bacterium]|nr:MAG: hypothetical protein ANABAC_0205 [Anaerolineae bacterium]
MRAKENEFCSIPVFADDIRALKLIVWKRLSFYLPILIFKARNNPFLDALMAF